MDVVLAKTFIAVCDVGSFIKASERLYVTQSTVSARIKQLEDQLGQALFVRTKAGASLTPAGQRFLPFAEKFVQTWEHARQEVALPESICSILTVGAEFTLWERLFVNWIPWIRKALPDLAVRAEVGTPGQLMTHLAEGLLDLAVTYTPQQRSGLIVEELMVEELVLAGSRADARGPEDGDYIYVDWGAEFRMAHTEAFQYSTSPVLAVDYGPLALQHIVVNGGSAYLPLRLVRPRLQDGSLHQIEGAPVFQRSAYIARYPSDDDVRFETAIEGLRYVAALEPEV